MRGLPSIAGLMFLAGLCVSSVYGQLLPTLENDYRNIFSQQTPPDWPPTAPVVNGVFPTAHQFENGSAFHGHVPPAVQTGPGVQLTSVILGRPLVLATPKYRF